MTAKTASGMVKKNLHKPIRIIYGKLLKAGLDVSPLDFYKMLVKNGYNFDGRRKATVPAKYLYKNWDKPAEELAGLASDRFSVDVDENYVEQACQRLGIRKYEKYLKKQKGTVQTTTDIVPKKRGRKQLVPDDGFLHYKRIVDPEKLAKRLSNTYKTDISPEYVERRLKEISDKRKKEEPEEPEPEKGKPSDKPKVPDEIILSYPHITSPTEMAETIYKDHSMRITYQDVRYRMKNLGMKIKRRFGGGRPKKETQPESQPEYHPPERQEREGGDKSIPDDVFLKHVNITNPSEMSRALANDGIEINPHSAKYRMEKLGFKITAAPPPARDAFKSCVDMMQEKNWLPNPVDLEKAMLHATKGKVKGEGLKAITRHVLNFFGYGLRIIDNVLEPEDRDAFYMFEDEKLLMTEREETTLYDGREWRIHYWVLNADKIVECANALRAEEKKPKDDANIYMNGEEIPDDIWHIREEKRITSSFSKQASSSCSRPQTSRQRQRPSPSSS